MMFMLPGEENLKLESYQKQWNPIFSSALETVYRQDRDKSLARYTYSKELLIDDLGTENNVK